LRSPELWSGWYQKRLPDGVRDLATATDAALARAAG
jgi:hypothetical protein